MAECRVTPYPGRRVNFYTRRRTSIPWGGPSLSDLRSRPTSLRTYLTQERRDGAVATHLARNVREPFCCSRGYAAAPSRLAAQSLTVLQRVRFGASRLHVPGLRRVCPTSRRSATGIPGLPGRRGPCLCADLRTRSAAAPVPVALGSALSARKERKGTQPSLSGDPSDRWF